MRRRRRRRRREGGGEGGGEGEEEEEEEELAVADVEAAILSNNLGSKCRGTDNYRNESLN